MRLRQRLFAFALIMLMLLTLLPAAFAHGERCPVCGMEVDTHEAKWTTTWSGETYYFCMEADQKAFEAAPEKYGGVLKLVRDVDGRAVVVLVRPRAPKPGDTCRLLVQVAPLGPDGMAPVDSGTVPIRSGIARVWSLDRARPASGRSLYLQPSGDPAKRGMSLVVEGAFPLRIRLELTLRDGTSLVTHVVVPVTDPRVAQHAAAKDEHHEDEPTEGKTTAPPHDHPAAAAAKDETHADAPPAPGQPLTMEAQHASMKVMSRSWLRVAHELESVAPDEDVALHELEKLEGWRRVMPRFSLHKHADQKAEFDGLTTAFGERLDLLRDDVSDGRWDAARTAWRAIDANDCTRCHLKFRWAIVPDLQQLPDLLGARGDDHAH